MDSYPEFRVAYTRLVVICTDNPLNLNEFETPWAHHGPFWVTPREACSTTLTSRSSPIPTTR